MPNNRNKRPTKTNIDDYLLDFDGIDFSKFSNHHESLQPGEKDMQRKSATAKHHHVGHDGDGSVATMPRFFF